VEHHHHQEEVKKEEEEEEDWDDISLHIKRYAVKFCKGRTSKHLYFKYIIQPIEEGG
jgi:hypothetical protein